MAWAVARSRDSCIERRSWLEYIQFSLWMHFVVVPCVAASVTATIADPHQYNGILRFAKLVFFRFTNSVL